jgi:hypothetical protein
MQRGILPAFIIGKEVVEYLFGPSFVSNVESLAGPDPGFHGHNTTELTSGALEPLGSCFRAVTAVFGRLEHGRKLGHFNKLQLLTDDGSKVGLEGSRYG